jgi:shikimate dehydrogenase
MGWPVAHSRSPAMHNAALQACGLHHWRYGLLPVPPELFEETVRALPGAGFRGVNVTIPHKEAALAVADHATERARQIGAANTLVFAGGAIHADNTDAPALIDALPWPVRGRTALVLGAGGSARAASWALRAAGAAAIHIWNRTPERASALAVEVGAEAVSELRGADVLVHCTPSGLHEPAAQLKDLPLDADAIPMFKCVVDFVYAQGGTELVREARARALVTVDGVELLVGQGALSFEQFTGLPAPVDVMRAAARGR